MIFGQRCSEVISWGDLHCDKQMVYYADNQPIDPQLVKSYGVHRTLLRGTQQRLARAVRAPQSGRRKQTETKPKLTVNGGATSHVSEVGHPREQFVFPEAPKVFSAKLTSTGRCPEQVSSLACVRSLCLKLQDVQMLLEVEASLNGRPHAAK